jgi:hypothetical protein
LVFCGGSLGGPQRPTPKPPQNTKPCPAPPTPGPRKKAVDQNIARAKQDAAENHENLMAIDHLTNLEDESLEVTDASSQNYKANPKYRGSAAYGNFNFGATMQARGFSLATALRYSNAFQWITTGHGDPKEDIKDVTNGYTYAKNNCNHH